MCIPVSASLHWRVDARAHMSSRSSQKVLILIRERARWLVSLEVSVITISFLQVASYMLYFCYDSFTVQCVQMVEVLLLCTNWRRFGRIGGSVGCSRVSADGLVLKL